MSETYTEPLELVDRAALEKFLAGVVPAYTELSIARLVGRDLDRVPWSSAQ